jgi:hypothetical protein
MTERKTVVWFLLLAFGISWPLFLLPIAFGSLGSQVRQMASLAAWSTAMWGPGLAAIVVTRFVAGQSLGKPAILILEAENLRCLTNDGIDPK